MTDCHFAQRCRQRGITSVPGNILAAWLREGIIAGDDNIARFVKQLDTDCDLYRFMVPEGIFYAVVGREDHWPRTVYTQRQKRRVLDALKTRRYRESREGGRTFIRFRDRGTA